MLYLVLLIKHLHRIGVLVLIALLRLLLLLLLCVADLHQALLLAREEEQDLIIQIVTRYTLLVFMLHNMLKKRPDEIGVNAALLDGAHMALLELIAKDMSKYARGDGGA